MKIGIAGAGGIGSNVAVNLIRSGIRQFVLADFDRVDESNLNRQFFFHDQIGRFKVAQLTENLIRIAPDAAIEGHVVHLDPDNIVDLFDDCDMIVEGVDGKQDKKLIVETLAPLGRPIVSASGVAGTCLDHIEVRQMGPCTIIGDFSTDAARQPCYAPKVAVVAAMMAHVILIKGGIYE